MADGVVVAELAFKPCWIARDANRWLNTCDHGHRLVDQLLRPFLVVLQALGVNVVIVFVDHKVQRTLAAVLAKLVNAPLHVYLHLRVVFGLGLLYAIFLHFFEHLVRCGLDFQNVRRLWGLWQACNNAVSIALEMVASRWFGERPLLASRRVDLVDRAANARQITINPWLL